MKVRAKALGFYGLERIKEGQEFELKKPEDISHMWMEPLDDEAREAMRARIDHINAHQKARQEAGLSARYVEAKDE